MSVQRVLLHNVLTRVLCKMVRAEMSSLFADTQSVSRQLHCRMDSELKGQYLAVTGDMWLMDFQVCSTEMHEDTLG